MTYPRTIAKFDNGGVSFKVGDDNEVLFTHVCPGHRTINLRVKQFLSSPRQILEDALLKLNPQRENQKAEQTIAPLLLEPPALLEKTLIGGDQKRAAFQGKIDHVPIICPRSQSAFDRGNHCIARETIL